MAAYVAALFGGGHFRRRSFLSGLKRPEKPNSIKKTKFPKTNVDRRFQIWYFSKPAVLESFSLSLSLFLEILQGRATIKIPLGLPEKNENSTIKQTHQMRSITTEPPTAKWVVRDQSSREVDRIRPLSAAVSDWEKVYNVRDMPRCTPASTSESALLVCHKTSRSRLSPKSLRVLIK